MKRLSCRQKQKYIQIVTEDIKKQIRETINNLAKKGVLNTDNFSRIISRGDDIISWGDNITSRDENILSVLNKTIEERFVEMAAMVVNRVKLIPGAEVLELDKIDVGENAVEIIKDYYNWNVHHGGHDFYIQREILSTKRTKVSVGKLIMGGTFTEIFGGLSSDIKSLCLTHLQVIKFLQEHTKWLFMKGYGTFFLLKDGNKFFVLRVYFDDIGYMLIEHDEVTDDNFAEWPAGHCRIVFQQQVIAN